MDEIKKGFVQTSSVRAILATTKINREKVAEEEIGSMMISKKISYHPNPIHFSGGVLFLTEEPLKAYMSVISSTLSGPIRLFPLFSLDDLKKIINHISIERVICNIRGNSSLCSEISNNLLSILSKSNNATSLFKVALNIQGVGEKFGFSPLPQGCENYGRILSEKMLKKECMDYAIFLKEKGLK